MVEMELLSKFVFVMNGNLLNNPISNIIYLYNQELLHSDSIKFVKYCKFPVIIFMNESMNVRNIRNIHRISCKPKLLNFLKLLKNNF